MEKASKGLKAGSYRTVGTTFDGVRILAPKTKPTHFTARQIRTTIDKVLRDSAKARGAMAGPASKRKRPAKSERT